MMKILIILVCLFKFGSCQVDGTFWWLSDNVFANPTKPPSTSNLAKPTHPHNQPTKPPSSDLAKPAPPRNTHSVSPIFPPLPKENTDFLDVKLTPQTEVCCECVAFFLCHEVSQTIITDGHGLLDVRVGASADEPEPVVNVEICPDTFSICCRVPDAPVGCVERLAGGVVTPTPPITEIFTPPPDAACECVAFDQCDVNLVVSNSKGLTSIELSNQRIVSHSKCTHSLDVCCVSPIQIKTINETVTTNSCDECVPDYLCGPDGVIITDGEGILQVRIKPVAPHKKCPHDASLVCCKPPVTDRGHTHSSTEAPPVDILCGKRFSTGVGIQIRGFTQGQTQFGEFPWMAVLLQLEHVGGKEITIFSGGASIIHPFIVLTAAHKVERVNAHQILVRVGEWDTKSEKEAQAHLDIGVKEIIFHPRFHSARLYNDLALLVLKEEIPKSYHINPICLAHDLNDVDQSACVVNGWGVDAFSSENYQHIMKSVEMPLVHRGPCQNLLRKTRLGRFFRLHHTFICAGGQKGEDACKGDGGGPLACPMKSDPLRYVQVGITAWGVGCGTENVPGVYANVIIQNRWILDQIALIEAQQGHISTIIK